MYNGKITRLRAFVHFNILFLYFLLSLFISLSIRDARYIEKDCIVTSKVPLFSSSCFANISIALWLYQNAPEGTHNSLVHRWLSSLKIDTGIEGLSRGESASIFSVHLCRGSIHAMPWKIQSVARRMHAHPRNLITRLRLADRTRRVCMTGRCA